MSAHFRESRNNDTWADNGPGSDCTLSGHYRRRMHECGKRHAICCDLINKTTSMGRAKSTNRTMTLHELLHVIHPKNRQTFQCPLAPFPLHVFNEVRNPNTRNPRRPSRQSQVQDFSRQESAMVDGSVPGVAFLNLREHHFLSHSEEAFGQVNDLLHVIVSKTLM